MLQRKQGHDESGIISQKPLPSGGGGGTTAEGETVAETVVGIAAAKFSHRHGSSVALNGSGELVIEGERWKILRNEGYFGLITI